jgi:Na+/phosphate symporter
VINIFLISAMCDEERRKARTLASKYVSQVYSCTEEARASIAKMGKYAQEMIAITKTHMQKATGNVTKDLGQIGPRPMPYNQ